MKVQRFKKVKIIFKKKIQSSRNYSMRSQVYYTVKIIKNMLAYTEKLVRVERTDRKFRKTLIYKQESHTLLGGM